MYTLTAASFRASDKVKVKSCTSLFRNKWRFCHGINKDLRKLLCETWGRKTRSEMWTTKEIRSFLDFLMCTVGYTYRNSPPRRHFPTLTVSTTITCHLFLLIIESAWTLLPDGRLLSPAAWFISAFHSAFPLTVLSSMREEQKKGGSLFVCDTDVLYISIKERKSERKDGQYVNMRHPTECMFLYQSALPYFANSVAL